MKMSIVAIGQAGGTQAIMQQVYIQVEYTEVSGYGHDVSGLASANIGKINGLATANIGKVSGLD